MMIDAAEENRKASKQMDNEVVYKTKTSRGTVSFKSSDIIEALSEQSKLEVVEITPPEEDLWGWSVINATDEQGASRPLFLMRVIPGNNVPLSYSQIAGDDKKIGEIILKDVYKLTPFKIKWIMFKKNMVNKFNRIFKRNKK